ncbi:MAG: hypothetical protein ABJG41_18070 [Cyclobacteriaceae bacterium]
MKKLILLFALALTGLTAHTQEKVYFPYFEMINVHGGYQYSTSKLLKTYIDNAGRYQLILPPKQEEGDYFPETFAETRENALAQGAPFFLTGEMNALEDIMIVSIGLYRTDDGQLIWSDLLKAASLDDLDPILILLSKAVGTKTKASQMEDIYSVSEFETNELTKKDASSTFGVYIGGVHTFHPNVRNNFSSGFGAKISYDLRDLILDLNGEFYFGDVDVLDFNLSALYPFTQGRKTPFVGGGLGYGSHRITQDEASFAPSENAKGLLGYAHAGYIFSRTSNVQLRATVTAYSAMYRLQGQVPFGMGFNLALSF